MSVTCPQCNAVYSDQADSCPRCGYESPNHYAMRMDAYAYAESISNESYFDGKLLQLIGWKILGAIVTVCTFGICFPWALCMVTRWETAHTVVNDYRLVFDGTALQLWGKWILWIILCVVTLGIYSFWVGIAIRRWRVKHTHFA